MKKIAPGALAALLVMALLVAPAYAAPANVTVRVEGAAQTVVPRSAVATDGAPVLVEGSNSCSGTSAGGALYKAVAGDLGGTWGAFGFLLERVKSETQTAPPNTDPAPFWSFWVNYRYQDQGLCAAELQEGDDVLVFADCFSATGKCASLTPLRIGAVPASVAPGQTISVKLEEFTTVFDPGSNTTATNPEPAEDATIRAAGQTVTTAADGTAHLTFSSPGAVSVEATKAGRVRTAALTCVTTGSDGACGGQLPANAVLGTGSSSDRTAPRASFSRLRHHKVYKRKRAPRKLAGRVTPDPSGLAEVRLSIKRRVDGRCWRYSGSNERFKRSLCDGWRSFAIGDRERWSYLLPKRLGKGRYALRAVAVDNAGNHSVTRVVIHVR